MNRFRVLTAAALIILGMKSIGKLPIVNAEEYNRPMTITSQNDYSREYSPEVIRFYNAYLQGKALQNQLNPGAKQGSIMGIDIAYQARQTLNMRFPFKDGLSQEELDGKILQVIGFLEETIFNGVRFNIEDAYGSSNLDDPYESQYVRDSEQVARNIGANPRTKAYWNECIESIRDLDRNSNQPSLELAISAALMGAKDMIDATYMYEQPNSNRIVPILAYYKFETNSQGLAEQVLFHSNDLSGSTFSQISQYGNYWYYYDKREKVGYEYTEEQLIAMGAERYGLFATFEEAHNTSVDALATVIRANAKQLKK